MTRRMSSPSFSTFSLGALWHRPPEFVYPGEDLRPVRRMSRATPDEALDGPARRAVEVGRTRMVVTACVFGLVFAAIGGRLIDLMVLKADPRAEATQRPAVTAPFNERADIVDRNGVVLATNLPVVNLYADARRVLDAPTAAQRLAGVLPGAQADDLEIRLSSGRPFVYLARNLTPRQQQEVNALGIPGVNFENSEYRAYLHGNLASHILGGTDLDNSGIAGIERSFDERLKTSNAPLRLTIDVRVQHAVRRALQDSVAHFKATGGTAIILDARTSEVLSMVNLPDYDPERLGEATEAGRFNGATLGVYEMGSTFKVLNTALALESGLVRLQDRYDATQPLRVARFSIRDHRGENRWLTVPEVLVHSSNIGSARIAMDVGAERQRAFLESLGMLRPVTIGLPEAGAPLFPDRWRDINTMTISYGHGIAVTPMHLAGAMAAMVNGGIMRSPTLLPDQVDTQGVQVISPQTSDTMRRLLRLVVQDGTARRAEVEGYRVGGKTGTAEMASSGGYDRRRLRTSFVSAFPMDDPRYVVLVILEEPQPLRETYGFATAGWNAAPTTGRIIAAAAPLLGVFPRAVEMDDKPTREALMRGQPVPLLAVRATEQAAGGIHAAQ